MADKAKKAVNSSTIPENLDYTGNQCGAAIRPEGVSFLRPPIRTTLLVSTAACSHLGRVLETTPGRLNVGSF